jgi:hypothetical protein
MLLGLVGGGDEQGGAAAGVGDGVHQLVVVGRRGADADADEVDAVLVLIAGAGGDDVEVGDAGVGAAVADEDDAVDAGRVELLPGEVVAGGQAAVEVGAAAGGEGVAPVDDRRVAGPGDHVTGELDRVLGVPADHRHDVAGSRRLAAMRRQTARCIAIGWPSIEPDSSRTRVTFMSGRSGFAIDSLETPICTTYWSPSAPSTRAISGHRASAPARRRGRGTRSS